MSNRLAQETSPYLLQHKDNPVDWYPWCDKAFERAKREDKPIFLSIGYSACHWCHVIAHESFEDAEIADLLNRFFISIKVDKEERPDIDSVYLSVCQAFTGSGGWPTTIVMTADQKPFFAGTYFPKTSRGNRIGLRELLLAIHEKWEHDRDSLLRQADEIIGQLRKTSVAVKKDHPDLPRKAVAQYARLYDAKNGGFGHAPKFPTPHNLLFLLDYYAITQNAACLNMAEHTLLQMYRGGLFDHIGFGFCRYSTDSRFLVPHFEKMLYDNALLTLAYCKAYALTEKPLYLEIAKKTAEYAMREMTSPQGGFYSSQDADSEGEEGKFYLFTPNEIEQVLGKEIGDRFNQQFDITSCGNFNGKNIPNLLKSGDFDVSFETFLPSLREYRKRRHSLHRDEKILTAWNGLMIAALCELYLLSKEERYLAAAKNADRFLQDNLREGDTLFVSFHLEKRGTPGFLDDYAAYIFAQLTLYRATLKENYLNRAIELNDRVIADFSDPAGGFYLYGNRHEALILRPKETYDGAIPSGNSLMAYNLVLLSLILGEEKYRNAAEKQLHFIACEYPVGYAMFLTALLADQNPPDQMRIVLGKDEERASLPLSLPYHAIAHLLSPTEDYPLKNGKTTYYVCRNQRCFPPTNDWSEVIPIKTRQKKGQAPL